MRQLVFHPQEFGAVGVFVRRDGEARHRGVVAHLVVVVPHIAGAAVGAAINGVVAFAGINPVAAAAGGNQVIAVARIHPVTVGAAACGLGHDGVRQVGAIPVVAGDGVAPGGGRVTHLRRFHDHQIFLAIGEAQHFHVGQGVGAVARIALGVDHAERIVHFGDGVARGRPRVFRHIHAVGAVVVPSLGAVVGFRPVGAAVNAVVAFVAAEGVGTGAAAQGVVARVAHQTVRAGKQSGVFAQRLARGGALHADALHGLAWLPRGRVPAAVDPDVGRQPNLLVGELQHVHVGHGVGAIRVVLAQVFDGEGHDPAHFLGSDFVFVGRARVTGAVFYVPGVGIGGAQQQLQARLQAARATAVDGVVAAAAVDVVATQARLDDVVASPGIDPIPFGRGIVGGGQRVGVDGVGELAGLNAVHAFVIWRSPEIGAQILASVAELQELDVAQHVFFASGLVLQLEAVVLGAQRPIGGLAVKVLRAVAAGAAIQRVVAGAAVQAIVARAAIEHVIAGATVQAIVARRAGDGVIAAARIVKALLVQLVGVVAVIAAKVVFRVRNDVHGTRGRHRRAGCAVFELELNQLLASRGRPVLRQVATGVRHPQVNVGGQQLRDGHGGLVVQRDAQVVARLALVGGVHRANHHRGGARLGIVERFVDDGARGVPHIHAVILGIAEVRNFAGRGVHLEHPAQVGNAQAQLAHVAAHHRHGQVAAVEIQGVAVLQNDLVAVVALRAHHVGPRLAVEANQAAGVVDVFVHVAQHRHQGQGWRAVFRLRHQGDPA